MVFCVADTKVSGEIATTILTQKRREKIHLKRWYMSAIIKGEEHYTIND
jgi:hypothetical protein